MHPTVFKTKHLSQGFHKARFPEAGNADQQRMAAAQQCYQCLVDNLALAKNHAANMFACFNQAATNLLDFANQLLAGVVVVLPGRAGIGWTHNLFSHLSEKIGKA